MLRAVPDHYCSIIEETIDVNFSISDNSNVIFNAMKTVFPLVIKLNCNFHFARNNVYDWGVCLSEATDIKNIENHPRKLQSITRMDHLLVTFQKSYEKHEHEPTLLSMKNHTVLRG